METKRGAPFNKRGGRVVVGVRIGTEDSVAGVSPTSEKYNQHCENEK